MEENTPESPFENPVLDTRELPRLDPDEFAQLPRRFHAFRLWSIAIFSLIVSASWVIPLCALIFKEDAERLPLTVVSILFGSLWLFVVGLLLLEEVRGFPLRGYVLREKDLTYRTGWMFRKVTTIPFNRIQHSEISQGPLGRAFKLNKLKIYTAGGATSDLSIPGLDPVEAIRLRDFVNGQAQDHA